MISQGSVSCPVRWRSTSRLNSSLGSSRALCSQVAQSNRCPSRRATLASSAALVHPTSLRSGLGIRGRCSWIDRKEHTSELQSRLHLVCRLLLEKKNSELHDAQPDFQPIDFCTDMSHNLKHS